MWLGTVSTEAAVPPRARVPLPLTTMTATTVTVAMRASSPSRSVTGLEHTGLPVRFQLNILSPTQRPSPKRENLVGRQDFDPRWAR